MSRFLDGPVIWAFLGAAVVIFVFVVAGPRVGVGPSRAAVAGRPTTGRDGSRTSRPVTVNHRPVRWAVYAAEHRLSTRLGRKLRAARRRIRQLERARTVQAHVEARPAHYDAWLCIHHYEGAWDANTGNGYFGGLQMDREFMADYGADLVARYGGHIVDEGGGVRRAYGGEADVWTPLEQMQVAENAWRTRGFWPWPNTARMCGLL